MNWFRMLTVASLLITPALAEEAPPAGKLIATTFGASRLHMVHPDGKISPFTLPAGTQWGSGTMGLSQDPLLSPDGRSVAYIHKGGVKFRSLDGKQTVTVVDGYPHEDLSLGGWSPTGDALVYFIGPPQGEDPPESKVTEPKYFVYELKTKQHREIKFPGYIAGWLPTGEMLLYDAEPGALLSLALTDGAKPKSIQAEAVGLGQISLSPDGKRLAASKSKPNDTSSSQLITMDLATGTVTPLTKPGDWAELQWPKWSPSGKRNSWEQRVGMKDGIPSVVLVVDGKPITKEGEIYGHLWLTETSLIVLQPKGIVVVDAATGKELRIRAFPKAKR